MLGAVERADTTAAGGATPASAVVTITIVAAVLVWIVMSFGAFWPGGTQVAAASTAYQYQYPATVNGSGSIEDVNGKVSFSIGVKFDGTGATGTCSINEPATKTKIKCLGVTSLFFVVFSADEFGAEFSGPATVNGVATTYNMTATDLGSGGADHDGFFVKTGTGFQRSGLVTGNISIHGVS
jgi:hypothetical protein